MSECFFRPPASQATPLPPPSPYMTTRLISFLRTCAYFFRCTFFYFVWHTKYYPLGVQEAKGWVISEEGGGPHRHLTFQCRVSVWFAPRQRATKNNRGKQKNDRRARVRKRREKRGGENIRFPAATKKIIRQRTKSGKRRKRSSMSFNRIIMNIFEASEPYFPRKYSKYFSFSGNFSLRVAIRSSAKRNEMEETCEELWSLSFVDNIKGTWVYVSTPDCLLPIRSNGPHRSDFRISGKKGGKRGGRQK